MAAPKDSVGDEVDYTPHLGRGDDDRHRRVGRRRAQLPRRQLRGRQRRHHGRRTSPATALPTRSSGSSAANDLDSAGGADMLSGGAGAGADGGDQFVGGTEIDTVTYDPASGTARTGNLTVDIDGTADDGTAGEADDVETTVENVTGGSGADNIIGSTANNQLRGGPGTAADTLSGDSRDDTMFGGTGSNTGPDGADVFNGGREHATPPPTRGEPTRSPPTSTARPTMARPARTTTSTRTSRTSSAAAPATPSPAATPATTRSTAAVATTTSSAGPAPPTTAPTRSSAERGRATT